MSSPIVSVIIPTYKRTYEYLTRAVNSVLNQTYENFEVIVIDDSPDTYEFRNEIIEKMQDLAAKEPRVKYLINEKNLGGSLARNRGIDIACGKYITFLDDDDEYLPEKLEHQVKFMEEQNCDLSFENMVMYNTDGAVVDVREYKDLEKFDNNTLLEYHLMKHLTGTPTFMFKTEELKRIGGFENAKMGQEFYLMLKSIENGLAIRYYPICDVRIYKHKDGGISQGRNKINGEMALYEFKKKYFDRLSKSQCAFINFRHYAVMVVAYLRNKMFFKAAWAAIRAFFSSPKDFFEQTFGFFRRISKVKK